MSERPDGCRLLTLPAIAPYVCVGTGIFHGRNKGASKMLPVCAMLKKESTRNEYFFKRYLRIPLLERQSRFLVQFRKRLISFEQQLLRFRRLYGF